MSNPLSEEEFKTLRFLQAKTPPLSEEDNKLLEFLKEKDMKENYKPVKNTQSVQLSPISQAGDNTPSPNRGRQQHLPPHSLLPNSTNGNSYYPMIPTPPLAPKSMSLQSTPTITEFNPPADIDRSTSLCRRLGNCLGFPSNRIANGTAGGKFTKNKRRKLRSSHKKVRAKKSKHNKHKRSSKRNKRYTRKH